MPLHVVDGATLICSLGSAPKKLKVTASGMEICGKKEANISDCKPISNIPSFGPCKCGSCKSQVTCQPSIPGPWVQVIPSVNGRDDTSLLQPAILNCTHGGVISITDPGQQKQSANPPTPQNVTLKSDVEKELSTAKQSQTRLGS
jgi:hypothetical protein